MAAAPEAWLRGPIPGIDPMLMPAAHALVQASEDLALAASGLSVAELWAKPGGAASVGFHLKHVCGSLARMITYARGRALDPAHPLALLGRVAAVEAQTVFIISSIRSFGISVFRGRLLRHKVV